MVSLVLKNQNLTFTGDNGIVKGISSKDAMPGAGAEDNRSLKRTLYIGQCPQDTNGFKTKKITDCIKYGCFTCQRFFQSVKVSDGEEINVHEKATPLPHFPSKYYTQQSKCVIGVYRLLGCYSCFDDQTCLNDLEA